MHRSHIESTIVCTLHQARNVVGLLEIVHKRGLNVSLDLLAVDNRNVNSGANGVHGVCKLAFRIVDERAVSRYLSLHTLLGISSGS